MTIRTIANGGSRLGGVQCSMLVTFRLIGFGTHGDGILLNLDHQSAKLIAVWTHLEPLPLVVSKPGVIIAWLFAFAFAQAVIYRLLAPAWPASPRRDAMRCASTLIFALLAS